MYEELIVKIDRLIEECTESLASDTIKLVNIKSVESESIPNAPFGRGPKEVLDAFYDMADNAGLYCSNYNVGVISASMKKGEADLGIWLHGDVVPEGDGWRFEPYSATECKGCIIGRGATDNKGQLAAVFNLFKIFKQLGIDLKYNPAIYLGSNEETGMKDIVGIDGNPDARGFINVCKPPKLSLVPDGGFPVGYGGKGGMNITLRSKTPLHSCIFTAGQDSSPGLATAVFNSDNIPDTLPECSVVRGKTTEVSSFTPPRHASNPDPNGNMITALSIALLDSGAITEEDKYIFEFFKKVSLDIHGEMFGIATDHDILGSLTVFSKKIDYNNGYPEIMLNIRYPLGITFEKITEKTEAYSEKNGFEVVSSKCGVLPYMLDPDNETAKILCKASNEVTGDNAKPYTMSGGTYAHRLPNAYVYGMSGNLPPDDFPKGRGGAHGIDEAVSLDRLKRAMKIYARALLYLNDVEW